MRGKGLALIVFLLLGAMYFSWQSYVLRGEVNENMERKVDNLINLPLPLIIDSNGGNTEAAFQISKKIYYKKKSLIVLGECISACAEYFLPAAKKVYFSNDALIGFHNNAFFQGHFYEGNNSTIINWCDSEKKEWLVKLYNEKGMNKEFYKLTVNRLDYLETEYYNTVRDNVQCKGSIYHSRKSTWFPTSSQLNILLGLKVNHSICADKERCWKRKIDSWSPRNTTYVIGDQNYRYGHE